MHERYAGWWDGPLPDRPDFGERYPWTLARRHALSIGFRRRVDQALGVLEQAAEIGGPWAACLSGGKDSTAVALLLHRLGWQPEGLSLRDDLCWRGEDAYLDALCVSTGLQLRKVVVSDALLALAAVEPRALSGDHESRSGALSGQWFAAVRRTDREYTGKILGLRADENDHRRRVRVTKGRLYQRADELWISSPLGDWSALDVHAMLAVEDVPPHPVYLCVDPGADALAMRHSWWVASGSFAHLHYVWLRRWWPELWDLAVSIDPALASHG